MQLHLDPKKTTPKSHTPSIHTAQSIGSAPIPRTPSSPQLSGAWASRSHVIRPPLPPTTPPEDLYMRNIRHATPPEDSPVRPHLPTTPTSEDSFGSSSRDSLSSNEISYSSKQAPPPGVWSNNRAPPRGAWTKPGSGVAAVRSKGQSAGQSTPRVPGQQRGHVTGPRALKHSMSGPINVQPPKDRGANFRRGYQSAGEAQFAEWRSRSSQQQERQKGVWSRGRKGHYGSDKRDYRHKYVQPIVESELEGAGFQRSYSTTHAHDEKGRGQDREGGARRMPYSEPTPYNNNRK